MNHINDSNSTDNNGKEDPFNSDPTVPFINYGLLSFFIILANSLILLLIWRKRRLRTTSNMILTSLAVSDLLTGLIAVPMVIVCSAVKRFEVCLPMDISNRFLAFSSVGHLTFLSIDRYIRVTKLLQYPSIVTEERLRCALASVWMFALLASMIQLSWILHPTIAEDTVNRFDLGYDFFHIAALVVVPLLVTSAIYTKLFTFLRRQSNEIHSELTKGSGSQVNKGRRQVNEKKIATIFIAMMAVFIVGLFFYFMWAIMNDLHAIGQHSMSPKAASAIVATIVFLRFLTALCNPLLCTFMKQDFRDALKSLVTGLRRSDTARLNSFSSRARAVSSVYSSREWLNGEICGECRSQVSSKKKNKKMYITHR